MLVPKVLIESAIREKFLRQNLKLAALFSGGPAPGGNLVIEAATRRAKHHDIPVVAFPNGYHLFYGADPSAIRPIPIGREELSHLQESQSLYIGTARDNPGKNVKEKADLDDPNKTAMLTKVLDVFERLRVGALISIGGDDTMRTANLLQMHYDQLNRSGKRFSNFMGVAHIPKTIDKDYVGIPFTFGYMTAVGAAGAHIRDLLADAKATGMPEKPVYYIDEVMGRESGWITAGASIKGGATYAILAEDYEGRQVPLEEVADDIVKIILKRREWGLHYGLITIAEGMGELLPKVKKEKVDAFGHLNLAGLGTVARICGAVEQTMTRRIHELGLSNVELKLIDRKDGYELRQQTPDCFDHLLCQQLGISAVNSILAGEFGRMITVNDVFNPGNIPFGQLVDPLTLKVKKWPLTPQEGLYRLLRAREEDYS